ncbi:MAG: short-chain dehydrogenase [Rhodospirillales bacterium]|nr:short-chain dehydrogenase [Rhodospirillales bacterium]
MSTGFKGKVALVTGASTGIGRATALLFGQRGAAVAVVARDPVKAALVVDEIRAAGGEAAFIGADMREPGDIAAMVAQTVKRFGGLHCAFNNAGVNGIAAPFHEQTLAEFERVVQVNLTSVFLCMQHEIRHMLGAAGGVIVNNCSGAGLIPAPELPHYTAAKHGLLGLAKVAAKEYANRNIRVNSICPGVIDTPMMQAHLGQDSGTIDALLAQLPGKRMGRPEDIARAAVWLCSDDAAYVSGDTMVVDGGLMAH